MTVQEAKTKLVDIARAEVGYHEGANNFTKYAAEPMIAKLYGWVPQNQPWCGTFVNWCFLTAFGYDIGSKLTYGGSAACKNAAQLFMSNGSFGSTPALCDQAFFYSGGDINHTGIVVEVNGSSFTTIEGNYSDKVSEVHHKVGASDVAGFGRPNWSMVQSTTSQPEKPSNSGQSQGKTENESTVDQVNHDWIPPFLSYSNKYSSDCVILQAILNKRKWPCGEVDGFFGPKTEAAVNRARSYFGMDQNGKCDRPLWMKLLSF